MTRLIQIPNQAFVNQMHYAQSEVLYLMDTPISMGGKRLFDIKWHRKARKCRAFGSILQLADGSIEKVENLIGKHFTVLSLNPDGTTKQCAAYAEFNGNFDVYTLKTENGRRLTVTENHPFLTLFGWKEVRELEETDMVLIPMDLPIEGCIEDINSDEIKFVAYMIGDGSLSSGNFRFSQQENVQLQEFKSIVKKFGGELVQINKYDYRINGTRLRDLARKYGIMGKTSGNKEIPSQIFKLKNHHIAVFISRLFSTDGYYDKKKNAVGYTSKSKVMIEQLQLLLLRFSITASISETYNEQTESDYYHLLIHNDEMVYRFACEIGIKGKLSRFDNISGEEKCSKKHKYKARIRRYSTLNNRFAYVKIKDLVYEGKQPTVAICVPETQNYISSFVEHNTTLIINVLIRECIRNPNSIYSYVGPTYTQARTIVWEDPNMLDRYLPDKSEFGWKKNETKLHIRFENGSLLRILGADDVDRLRGPDNMGVGFDEWQLIDPRAWTAVFFPMINLFPDRWAIFSWTAFGRNHAQEMREVRSEDSRWHVMTLPAYDSPAGKASGLLTKEQLEDARKEMPEPLYRQEYGCEDISEEQQCLISTAMIDELAKINWPDHQFLTPEPRKIVAIDTAFGGDICSIRGMRNTKTIFIDHSHPTKTEEIILKAKLMAQKLGTKNFISDCIGWGKGVTDGLAADEAQYHVQYFNASESAAKTRAKTNQYGEAMCVNMRAEAYWHTAQEIRKQRVQPFSIETPVLAADAKELLRQLPKASKYRAGSGGKILIIPKEEIRKELKCSPDDSDSYVMGIYGTQFVTPEPDTESMLEIVPAGVILNDPDNPLSGLTIEQMRALPENLKNLLQISNKSKYSISREKMRQDNQRQDPMVCY